MPSSHPRPAATRLWLLGALAPLALLASCSTQATVSNSGGGSPAQPVPTTAAGNGPSANGPSTSASATLFEKPRKPDGPVTIQIVTNGVSPFWTPMEIGMNRMKDELKDCEARWTPPDPADVAAQKRVIEDAVGRGIDGLAVSTIQADATTDTINSVLDKGIPVITFDSDAPKSRRLCYIGTLNYNAGLRAGEAAVKLMPNGGTFVGFVGNISADNARERRDGFIAATKDHNINLLTVLDDHTDKGRARRNVEDVITNQGDKVTGLLGLFSYNAPAIAQAVTAANKRDKYKIVTFDAEPETLIQLEQGNIDATIVQKPYDFGRLTTKLLYEINRKGWPAAKKEMKIPDNGLYDTGVITVTPQSVKAYRESLKKLGIESS